MRIVHTQLNRIVVHGHDNIANPIEWRTASNPGVSQFGRKETNRMVIVFDHKRIISHFTYAPTHFRNGHVQRCDRIGKSEIADHLCQISINFGSNFLIGILQHEWLDAVEHQIWCIVQERLENASEQACRWHIGPVTNAISTITVAGCDIPKFWKSIAILAKLMSITTFCVRIWPSLSTPSVAFPFTITVCNVTVNGPDAFENNVLSV